MRNWINVIETYGSENSHALHTLHDNTFDYYNNWYYVARWASETDNFEIFEPSFGHVPDEGELQESDPEIFKALPVDIQEEISEWVSDELSRHEPAELPSSHYFHPDKQLIHRQTWLVHFSDAAHHIAYNGFTHGSYDARRLGLTTYYSHDSKESGGYNFAFEALSRDAIHAAESKKYGQHAVLFQNSGVKAWHNGDEENQIIFWGPDVNPSLIFELHNNHGDWEVVGRDRVYFTGTYDQAVKWVIQNNHQYRKKL